ncbi:hypothetical protein GGR52DRAFT_528397 [Hypoxylon sp. FL1284]|nr:hypothetical protein GGR52DRAFT_528397 [Hypoxylon sp. FL1284]
MRFCNQLRKWTDLQILLSIPGVEEEIISTIIVRWLMDAIFSTILCGRAGRTADVLTTIEYAMIRANYDNISIRSWMAQACSAMFADPGIQNRRTEAVRTLTEELATMLNFLSDRRTNFVASIAREIVEPAMALHEKFLSSNSMFQLRMNSKFTPGRAFTGGRIADLKSVQLINTPGNSEFDIEKLSPPPTLQEIQQGLEIIASNRPALEVIEVGVGSMKEARVIRKEVILVAWKWAPRAGVELPTWLPEIVAIGQAMLDSQQGQGTPQAPAMPQAQAMPQTPLKWSSPTAFQSAS